MQHREGVSAGAGLFGPGIDTRVAGGRSGVSPGWKQSTRLEQRAMGRSWSTQRLVWKLAALFSASQLILAQLILFLFQRKKGTLRTKEGNKTQLKSSCKDPPKTHRLGRDARSPRRAAVTQRRGGLGAGARAGFAGQGVTPRSTQTASPPSWPPRTLTHGRRSSVRSKHARAKEQGRQRAAMLSHGTTRPSPPPEGQSSGDGLLGSTHGCRPAAALR